MAYPPPIENSDIDYNKGPAIIWGVALRNSPENCRFQQNHAYNENSVTAAA
jgi:hypothetical protein